jgi:hypothetical protein
MCLLKPNHKTRRPPRTSYKKIPTKTQPNKKTSHHLTLTPINKKYNKIKNYVPFALWINKLT